MHYCAYHWSGIYISPVRDCGIYSRRVDFSLSFADDGVSDRSATSLTLSAPFTRLVDYYYISWLNSLHVGSHPLAPGDASCFLAYVAVLDLLVCACRGCSASTPLSVPPWLQRCECWAAACARMCGPGGIGPGYVSRTEERDLRRYRRSSYV